MTNKTDHPLNQLPDLGITRIVIDPCRKGWQCTLSSDGPGLQTTAARNDTPLTALQAAIKRFKRLHVDPATLSKRGPHDE